jgi:hypothetical protein
VNFTKVAPSAASLVSTGARRLQRMYWIIIDAQTPGGTMELAHDELGGPCLPISHLGANGTHHFTWGRYPRLFGLDPPGAQRYLVSI